MRFFEREWLVNLILFGHYARLRDAALAALAPFLGRHNLQVACVYGDLTPRLLQRLPDHGHLDVVDVLPIQLANLAAKLPPNRPVQLWQRDAAELGLASSHYDSALLFFLLHEQPADHRRRTLSEALRVLKPGGRLVVVDYHRPSRLHPLYLPMKALLASLEPYALDLWRQPVREFLPADGSATLVSQKLFFGGLYQLQVFSRNAPIST